MVPDEIGVARSIRIREGMEFVAVGSKLEAAQFDAQSIVSQLMKSQVAGVLVDATHSDMPILECNQAFVDLTGYSRSEINGRNCRFLSRGHTDAETRARFRSAIDEARPAIIEVVNFRKDGSPFINGVTVAPISNDEGEIVYFLGSQVDLGSPKSTGSNPPKDTNLGPLENLTPRQREAVIYMASGMPIKQIASELGLAERTVKMHRTRAMQALGVDNRIDAVRIALEAGF